MTTLCRHYISTDPVTNLHSNAESSMGCPRATRCSEISPSGSFRRGMAAHRYFDSAQRLTHPLRVKAWTDARCDWPLVLSSLNEGEQILVHLVLVRRASAVRGALLHFEHRPLNDLGRKQRRVRDRNDLIVVAMHHQGRHVELLEVLREVRLREGLDAAKDRIDAREHSLVPEGFSHAFRNLRARPVVAVEA